ncbi:MAG: hypothetical protein AAF411_11015 [Myxococcota bacterium]
MVREEHDRFIDLYAAKVSHSIAYIADLAEISWSDGIAETVKHLLVAERFWSQVIASLRPGEAIPGPPGNDVLLIDGPALLPAYREALPAIVAGFRSPSPSFASATFRFAGAGVQGLEFLWSVLAHHAYHLGQIDAAMRAQGCSPRGFFPWARAGKPAKGEKPNAAIGID